ncbi:RNA polymerase sigma factor [Povalibacter sp.]|uniref:RNA polymerase sigma factor n=1 Tax=Povalibacter sp. TaxID=1962978 RepID=UPI002F411CAB
MKELSDAVQTAWHRFLDVYEPLRPDLYRYCRYLTRSPWDAEDLAQDTLARGFVTLGCLFKDVPSNPRAWLFRVASNLWIDRARRSREVVGHFPDGHVPDVASEPLPQVDPEALGALLVKLSPQERAAVVLKDVFDFTLEEISESLSTSVGAVKSALSRGRSKLSEPLRDGAEIRLPVPAVLNAFCDAFNARDLDRMTALLLDTAEVEMVGLVTEYGPATARDAATGSFHGMLYSDLSSEDPRGGVDRPLRHGVIGTPPRSEVRDYRGEPIVLFWYQHSGGEAVRAVARMTAEADRLARVRNYFFNPDVIADICRELDVPYHVNGYRYWSAA